METLLGIRPLYGISDPIRVMEVHDGCHTFPALASMSPQIAFRDALYGSRDAVNDLNLHTTEIVTSGANGISPVFFSIYYVGQLVMHCCSSFRPYKTDI